MIERPDLEEKNVPPQLSPNNIAALDQKYRKEISDLVEKIRALRSKLAAQQDRLKQISMNGTRDIALEMNVYGTENSIKVLETKQKEIEANAIKLDRQHESYLDSTH